MSDFKVGDVVLIKHGGFGLKSENIDKYVKLVKYKPEEDRWIVKGYGCELVGHEEDYAIDIGSFGETPMILLNMNEKPLMLEEHPLESCPNKGYDLKGSPAKDALTVQVGGGHYKGFKIQPVEYIYANNIPFLEGNVIKYTSRHRDKNRAVDIKKAIHCLELILKLEYAGEV